jgi:hypothetical protein
MIVKLRWHFMRRGFMNKTNNHENISRRNFLKLLGIGGVAAVSATLLDTYAPWIDDDERLKQIMKPLDTGSNTPNQKLELVRFATLAASGHNTQPWKFAVQENNIQIHPDYSRHLPVVDPNNREMWISLGCALENLLIAAHAVGYATEVTYPDTTELIDVRLIEDSPQKSALLDAIPVRQNTRSEYDGQLLKTIHFEEIQSLPLEPGVALRFAANPADLEIFLEYVNQGNIQQYSDRSFIEELIHWLRFNKKEVLKTMDGLSSRCTGNPEAPRWIGQWFVSGTNPQQQADADAKKLRSSSGAVVIASESDDRSNWVRTGQVYERMALKMTSLNIKSAFLNQPIEVSDIRTQFQSAIGLESSLPQLLVRFGYAEALPHSLRRPVDQVLIKS